ncbi:MAG: hypothetical protein J6S13_05025 [Clostridia bacterium]|nr:hypothetical protein [Clostridia bacterium]
MFLGMKTVNVGDSRRVHLLPGMKEYVEVGQEYKVYRGVDWDNGKYTLVFRFDDMAQEGEVFVKEYKIPANKTIKVPPEVYTEMQGECDLVGMFDRIELVRSDCVDTPSLDDIEKLAKSLDLI